MHMVTWTRGSASESSAVQWSVQPVQVERRSLRLIAVPKLDIVPFGTCLVQEGWWYVVFVITLHMVAIFWNLWGGASSASIGARAIILSKERPHRTWESRVGICIPEKVALSRSECASQLSSGGASRLLQEFVFGTSYKPRLAASLRPRANAGLRLSEGCMWDRFLAEGIELVLCVTAWMAAKVSFSTSQ